MELTLTLIGYLLAILDFTKYIDKIENVLQICLRSYDSFINNFDFEKSSVLIKILFVGIPSFIIALLFVGFTSINKAEFLVSLFEEERPFIKPYGYYDEIHEKTHTIALVIFTLVFLSFYKYIYSFVMKSIHGILWIFWCVFYVLNKPKSGILGTIGFIIASVSTLKYFMNG